MSARHQGRHRSADGGPGRSSRPVEQRAPGRHRAPVGRPTATRPLLAASGTVAAALTAVVLSGAEGPLGALFPEREGEPRPATASASPRGGAPTAGDIDSVARSYAAGSGGMGSSWGLSIWDVLFQPDLESAPAMPDDGSAAVVWGPMGTGAAAGSTPFLASAGWPSTPLGTAPSIPSTATSTPSAVGNGTWQDPRGGDPDGAAGPQAPTTGTPPTPDAGAPANPSPVPVTPPVQTLPPTPTTPSEPVITAADPVIEAAEPVVRAVEPVITAVEPEPAPVPKAPEPVEDALESVDRAASEAPEPEVEDLPALPGEDLDLPAVELPG